MHDEVEARLRGLIAKHCGTITPNQVLSDAKKRTSALHTKAGYEWDVNKAAEREWLNHSRKLIRKLQRYVRTASCDVATPALVRDPTRLAGEQGYILTTKLKRSKAAARLALAGYLRTAMAAMYGARRVALALGLVDRVDSMLNELEALRRETEVK